MNVSIRKPMGNGYSENPTTIGAKIRNRRLELQLFQKDVALFCGVSEDAVTYWENGRSEPQVQNYPKIVEFLGYFPFDIDTSTLGGKIREYRYSNGLSYKELGKIVGVDGTTIGDWEANECCPREEAVRKLLEVFGEKIF